MVCFRDSNKTVCIMDKNVENPKHKFDIIMTKKSCQ